MHNLITHRISFLAADSCDMTYDRADSSCDMNWLIAMRVSPTLPGRLLTATDVPADDDGAGAMSMLPKSRRADVFTIDELRKLNSRCIVAKPSATSPWPPFNPTANVTTGAAEPEGATPPRPPPMVAAELEEGRGPCGSGGDATAVRGTGMEETLRGERQPDVGPGATRSPRINCATKYA